MIGRERERRVLLGALDDAIGGRGGVVLVFGDAGIGKTTVARQVAEDAIARGAECAWATCWEDDIAPAFWPWVQVLRALHDRRPDLVQAEANLAVLLPELGDANPAAEYARHEPEEARFRLFDLVARLILTVAAGAPLVIVLEDLHSSDDASLSLLDFLGREIGQARVLVVGTYRDVDVAAHGRLTRLLSRLGSTAMRLPLGPLDTEGMGALIRQLTDSDPSVELVAHLHRRTGGNPLFVREVVRLAQAQGTSLIDHVVPTGVRAVLERRVARLPQATHELLATASVLGPEFEVEILAHLAAISTGRARETLGAAVSARLVDESLVNGRYSFSHALLRDSVYAGLPADARRSLHRRAAAIIEDRHRVNLEPRLAELAHHLSRSVAQETRDHAIGVTIGAARQAQSMLAYEDAARWYQQALALLTTADDDRRLTILLELGEVEVAGSALDRSRATFLAAAEIARRTARHEELARAALGLGAGRGGFEVRLHDRHQIELLEEALRLLPRVDSALRAWVLARLSVAAACSEIPDVDRVEMSRGAADMARRIGDAGALAYALSSFCDAIAGPDHVEERLEIAEEMIAIARAGGDRPMELLARRFRLVALLEHGDFIGFDHELVRFTSLAVVLSQPLSLWYVPLFRGMRALMRGRFDEAGRLAAEAEAIGRRAGSDNAEVLCMTLRAAIDFDRGCYRAELEVFDALVKRFPEMDTYPSMHALRSCLLALTGQLAAAEAELNAAAAYGFANVRRDGEWLETMASLAQACALIGNPGHAASLLQLLEPYATQFPIDGIAAACYGSAARYVGLLATVLDRFAVAELYFDRARRDNERAGAPVFVANVDRDRAEMHLRRDAPGDRETAVALLRGARNAYAELGASGHVARIDGRLLDLNQPGSVPAANASANLFRREGDVWHLEYAGRHAIMRDAKGLRDLAHLLGAPGESVHVAELVAASDGAREALQRDRGTDVLDARARAEYRARLAELQAEVRDAEADSDLARAERARTEHDFLAAELASAVGLGGRSRRLGDAAERARKSVNGRIGMTLGRMNQVHPDLARHLGTSVHTGTFCVYAPEQRTFWQL